MKKLVISIAVLLTTTAFGATSASASDAPLRVTFDKHVVDAATFSFAGTTGGDAPGTLTSQLVAIERVSGPVYHVTFDWFVTAGSHSFVARTSGIWNTKRGLVTMNGSVTSGYLDGANVHEQGELVDPATLRFQGVIQVMPGAV
jgi:hypothetical protein